MAKLDEKWCEPHHLYYGEKVEATQVVGWDKMPVCDEHAVTSAKFYEATTKKLTSKGE